MAAAAEGGEQPTFIIFYYYYYYYDDDDDDEMPLPLGERPCEAERRYGANPKNNDNDNDNDNLMQTNTQPLRCQARLLSRLGS